MNINTQLTISATDLFDALEPHIEEFVGHAMKFQVCDIADDIGSLEETTRGQGSLLNDSIDRLDEIEETLLDIRAEDADILRAVAQDVIDGHDFIDEDELSERIDGLLEEDDLAWRVEDIIGDADLMTEDEIRDLVDEKIDDNMADAMETIRRYGDNLNAAMDLLRRQREEMEGLQAEIAMAMNEAMIARRSTTILLERQPRERVRNAYWTARNLITDLRIKLTRKG